MIDMIYPFSLTICLGILLWQCGQITKYDFSPHCGHFALSGILPNMLPKENLGLKLDKDFSCKKVFMKFKNRLKKQSGVHETLPYEIRAKLEKQNTWLMDFLKDKE